MRVRHKIPSVFNLAMVDVLCCALGCVILIWLLNSKLAADEAEEQAGQRARLLADAESAKARSDKVLSGLRGDKAQQAARLREILAQRDKAVAFAAELAQRIEALEADRLALQEALASEKKGLARAKGELGKAKAGLEKDLEALMERYQKQKRVTVALDRDLAAMLARIKVTETALDKAKGREKEEAARAGLLKKSIEVKQRDLLALASLLQEAKKASDALKKNLDARDLELAASRDSKLDLEKLLRLRQIALDDAGKSLKRLENEKLVLRTAVENRFAGIELTGKRVVFLVDTSGSMVLLDSKTNAPHKWREVRQTVAKLMRSMPGLEKYQVVTFAAAPKYALGKPGEWLDYDRAASPAKVAKALEAIKPDGGTNMYAALDQAFAFRGKGMDAVYLLSDGLPNLGEGLSAREARELNEVDKGQLLGRVVRKKLDDDWNGARAGRAKVPIHTIGFFYESPDLGSFLWALARENNGSFVGMSKP